ncbi:MAG: NUDIX domain-containing protein [Butyrivibrio sp.]|uniref:NUDIX domain-containing protein n=1 Tax=Butyrivibrio sp. TaxID=28121 RepID=UPI0025C48374|nr:NUDIX domain-containing protein [Butyrivibrio sp.]MBQ6589493.1 NUDIX domain-containing protein [Butyrivibrio sp.]
MKERDILGENRFETYTKTREGCRAVIVQDGKILLSHEHVVGWWLIPGGGLEEGETLEECVVREVEEETGKIVRPLYQYLKINEYYEEWRYIDDYFVCELVGDGQMKLTEAEIRRGVKPEWIPLEDAIEMFSKHQDYAETEEEKRGAFLREYIALQEYVKTIGWHYK